MVIDRRRLIIGASASVSIPAIDLLSLGQAAAQNGAIRIGVLTDLSGPFTAISGLGSVACAKLATLEFANRGVSIDLLVADHQNKPDVAVNIVRNWLDTERVSAIVELTSSTIALAVSQVTREKNGILLASGPATSTLTGQAGSPNTIHWTYSDAMLAASAATLVKDKLDSWFFITSDARFALDLEKYTTTFVKRSGGSVIGSFHVPPLASTDLSSPLEQAKKQAKVIALATLGDTTLSAIRQISEINTSEAKVLALQLLISDVHALGLQKCQKTLLTETFYWDLNDRTRQLSSRVERMPAVFSQRFEGKPNMIQAGCYSAVLHYLKAVFDLGVSRAKDSGRDTVERMKRMPTDDDAFGKGKIRDDGRKIHSAFLFQVKSPSQSKGAWDYYQLVRAIPADEAFGFDPITGCSECGDGCRCQNTCTCQKGCCPN